MKKRTWRLLGAAVLVVCTLAALGLMGCASQEAPSNTPAANTTTESAPINVVSREDGSGTRGAFVELFEVQEDGKDGKKVDATTTAAVITNSTSVMLTTVAGDKDAIGYISLGSLNNTVKALAIDGVAATTANVKAGSYKISRPFNIVTKGKVSAPAQAFIDFILSAEGQAVITGDHYIAVDDAAKAFKDSGAKGKVIVAGSSSVTPVMEKLKEAYVALNPNVTIEIQQSDSSTGISSTVDGICDIGMASRELKDTEQGSGLTATAIAIDGIAVIVNNNRALSGLTKAQVQSVFLGTVDNWQGL